MICDGCERKKEAENGICKNPSVEDGLSVRCVGEWSKEKHMYLEKYVDAFVTSMRKRWKLTYIDLFSGPGKCLIRGTDELIDGSPLIAMKSNCQFNFMHFVDLNKTALEALERRMTVLPNRIVKYYNEDCNTAIDKIIDDFKEDMLGLAFIDPTGLNVKFETIKKLSTKRIDLIVNFPYGMAFLRNVKQAHESEDSILDEMIGDKEWRKLPNVDHIVAYYENKLKSLGYIEVKHGKMIRSTKGNVPLYYLIFISKHPLGNKFWKDVNKTDIKKQSNLSGID